MDPHNPNGFDHIPSGGYTEHLRDNSHIDQSYSWPRANEIPNRTWEKGGRKSPEGDNTSRYCARPPSVSSNTSHTSSTTTIRSTPISAGICHNDMVAESKKREEWSCMFKTISAIMEPMGRQVGQQSVAFDVSWDVDNFFSEEIEGNKDFAPILTLTGTIDKAYASSCEDYVKRFWPSFGMEMIKSILPLTLVHVSDFEAPVKLEIEGLAVKIDRPSSNNNSTAFHLGAHGPARKLLKLAEFLTWITAVFRRPKQNQVSYSVSSFQRVSGDTFKIGTLPLVPIAKEELCWCSMFKGMVIAKEFLVPERKIGIGLELSFDLMLVLGRIWYPMEYLDGFVLKGRSTILIPTWKSQDSVQWHFLAEENPRIRISMQTVRELCYEVVQGVGIDFLRSARAFVGWAMDAETRAGTRSSGFESIQNSKALFTPRRPRLAREMTPSIGTSGLGFFNFNFGAKLVVPKDVFGPVRKEHILMEDMLLNSKEDPLLLWDVGTARGWMVSELATILTILHVWALRQTDSDELLEKIPFAQQSSNDGEASYKAIREHRNLQLRSSGADGEGLPLMTQLKNIMAALESRKEEVVKRDRAFSRFSNSTYLHGWELTDIAGSKPWFREKRVVLDDTCGTWPSILADRPEVVILFCQGVSDLIQPTFDEPYCGIWKSVPKGHSYLAATVTSIVSMDLHCRAADRFKSCAFDNKNCPSRLQELHQKPPTRSIPIPQTGAIIVGRSHHSLFKVCAPDPMVSDRLRRQSTEKEKLQNSRNVATSANEESSHIPGLKITNEIISACDSRVGVNKSRKEPNAHDAAFS